ncbi:hypothetical protein ACP4OV_026842 [Aristida adscensionis]
MLPRRLLLRAPAALSLHRVLRSSHAKESTVQSFLRLLSWLEAWLLSSTPHKSELQDEVKKILSSVPRQSTGPRPNPGRSGRSCRLRCSCVRVGQRFGGFLDLREKVFFLTNAWEASYPPQNMCYRDRLNLSSCCFQSTSDHTFRVARSTAKELLDPFARIKDEVSEITNRLRSMVVAEVPELTSAAGYFFRAGAEGKRTCPTVLLLMASALSMDITDPIGGLEHKSRARYMRIAEITEMIPISSLIHDDVLDNADTKHGMESLNFAMGNKLAVLAGDFILSRAFFAAASLDNTEVVSLLANAVNNLVTGELMQMKITPEQRCKDILEDSYVDFKQLQSYCSSCRANSRSTSSCLSIWQTLGGIAYQLIDDILDFTGTSTSLGKASLSDIHQELGFDDPSDIDTPRVSRGRGHLLLNMRNWQQTPLMLFLRARMQLCLTQDKHSKILLKIS